MMQSTKELPTAKNIVLDPSGLAITENSPFLTVCDKGTSAYAMKCTTPGSFLDGSGYGQGYGGSTGWMTTQAPISHSEDVTLRFLIFDEGDHLIDSAVALDQFRWRTDTVAAPITSH
jgi:hypothetical protein